MHENLATSAIAPTHEESPLRARCETAVPSASAGFRLGACAVALGAGAILALAAILDPSPTGVGTHQQLALPPCGWIAVAGIPCPTCGMTTAFAHAANGDVVASARAQPAGFLMALVTATAFSGAAYVAITGERIGWALERIFRPSVGWYALAVLVAAWAYKVLSHLSSSSPEGGLP